MDCAILFDGLCLLRKDCFGIDSSHAEEGDDPHPKDSAGAAGEDSAACADYVAGADLRRDGCCKRLERAQTALLLSAVQADLAEHAAHTLAEAAHLNEPRLYTEEYTDADKQDHQYVIRKIEVDFLNNA